MIIVSQYELVVKGKIMEIHIKEQSFCPICTGNLLMHGTCVRKLRMPDKDMELSLRVLYCPECKRTHRELPDLIIPYKRHCAQTYAEVYEVKREELACNVDDKTIRSIRAWVKWFLEFAASFMEGLKIEHPELPTNYDVGSTLSALKFFVRLVVNANEWKFSVPPLLS